MNKSFETHPWISISLPEEQLAADQQSGGLRPGQSYLSGKLSTASTTSEKHRLWVLLGRVTISRYIIVILEITVMIQYYFRFALNLLTRNATRAFEHERRGPMHEVGMSSCVASRLPSSTQSNSMLLLYIEHTTSVSIPRYHKPHTSSPIQRTLCLCATPLKIRTNLLCSW